MSDVLVLDSACSFTYNIAHAIGELGGAVSVEPVGQRSPVAIRQAAPQLVVLGPGPRRPEDLPALTDVARALVGAVPVFGICLGHQALGVMAGGAAVRAREPVHGRTVEIDHRGQGMFAQLRSPMRVMRYNSLVLAAPPPGYTVTARGAHGEIMALAHQSAPCWSVQFHPESIGTFGGMQLLANVLDLAGVTGEKVRQRWKNRTGGVPPQSSGTSIRDNTPGVAGTVT